MRLLKQITATIIVVYGMLPQANAQTTVGSVKPIVAAIDSFGQRLNPEKLYIHTDKSFYHINDTLWFKAYLLDASFFKASNQSNLFYVELANDNNTVIKRLQYPVVNGVGLGDMILNDEALTEGAYTLRAYTNWMRNAGEEAIYSQQLFLTNTIKPRQKEESPAKANQLAVSKKVVVAKKTVIKNPLDIDLQFMPEGGHLVADISTRIGFKAVAANGRGVEIKGYIKNKAGEKVADFETAHKGMGAIDFSPKSGETYTATINGADGLLHDYVLPTVQTSGIVLNVTNEIGKDSVEMELKASANLVGGTSTYYVVGTARGVVCYGGTVRFKQQTIVRKFPITQFPSGILTFTVFDENKQPINERSVFVNQDDGLKISVSSAQKKYLTTDSIEMMLHVLDKSGQPAKGNFSLSVTDDALVPQDSLSMPTILSHLLLSSQLKGVVEEPGFYFLQGNMKYVDDLMLTQGWGGYDWKTVFDKPLPLPFLPETNLIVGGVVKDELGIPIVGAKVNLYSRKPFFVADTVANNLGRFVFPPMVPMEAPEFIVKATNKRDKSNNVEIVVDRFLPPSFQLTKNKVLLWYGSSDSSVLHFKQQSKTFQQEIDRLVEIGKILPPVVVKAKKAVKGSANKNGVGKADFILDETDIKNAGSKTLQELLEEKVAGFQVIKGPGTFSYAVKGKPLMLVFDGTDPFYVAQQPNTNYLNYFMAEDVTGIELMYNVGTTAMYANWFAPKTGSLNTSTSDSGRRMLGDDDVAFVEITTRAQQGPFMKKTPGVSVFRPMPLQLPRQFYQPKYLPADNGINLSSNKPATLYWNPIINVGANGQGVVSFDAGKLGGNFTVHIEGADMDGGIGTKEEKMVIVPPVIL